LIRAYGSLFAAPGLVAVRADAFGFDGERRLFVSVSGLLAGVDSSAADGPL
jgi:hypothetical protein